MHMHVDCFTTLDDVNRKDQGNALLVLSVIMRCGGRFSVFDSNSDAMARSLTTICHSDWVRRPEPQPGYPWTKLELTESGRTALKSAGYASPAPPPADQAAPTGGPPDRQSG